MKEEYIVTIEGDKSLQFNDSSGSGWYVRETWTLDSQIHRQYGPAITTFHPFTERPLKEEYYRKGERHRYTGPALIEYDHSTGQVTAMRFFEKGKEVAPRHPWLYRTIPVINGP